MHAQQAELAQLTGHVQGELRVLEPLGDAREDPVENPRPDGVPNVAFLVGEEGIDVQEIEWVDPAWRAAHRASLYRAG